MKARTALLSRKAPVAGGDTVVSALGTLLSRLTPGRRHAIGPLLILMLFGAMAEVITLGALLPFLAAIADPEGSPVLAYVAPLLDLFGSRDPDRVIYVLTGLFVLAAAVAAGVRLLLLWTSQSFIYGVSYELAVLLYSDALHEPYALHIRRNSSEIIAAINKVQLVTNNVLVPLMQGIVALVIASFIVACLIVIDPIAALVAGGGFSAIYLVALTKTRGRLKRNSNVISDSQGRRVKAMQEGLGGIRDVLLDQSQPVFLETYERAEAGYRDARVHNAFFSGAPRFLVEAAGVIIMATVAILVTKRPGGLIEAVPVLGVLAFGAQRLLPLVQQIYNGWAQTIGHRQVLLDVAEMAHRQPPHVRPVGPALLFEKSISLNKVGFSYSEGCARALHDIDLKIPKGSRVGIVGKTGSGKSTLMDLILGLLDPTEGEIAIDGRRLTAANRISWQKNIAHVPQFIYLADATIAENIAFGVRPGAIDHQRMRDAAERAELADVIASLPNAHDTRIGERGIQLSGGQRQRIGIARALYKQASVLVFDEATSALDSETEAAVMAAIGRLDRNLTIFIIAHRLTTLEGCDMIVKLERGSANMVEDWMETRGARGRQRSGT